LQQAAVETGCFGLEESAAVGLVALLLFSAVAAFVVVLAASCGFAVAVFVAVLAASCGFAFVGSLVRLRVRLAREVSWLLSFCLVWRLVRFVLRVLLFVFGVVLLGFGDWWVTLWGFELSLVLVMFVVVMFVVDHW
jgi:hypothetical protein